MRNYETTFILNPNLTEEQETAVVEKISSIITSASGEIVELNRWGKKRLSYEIGDFKEGNYIVLKFRSLPDQAAEVGRILKIQDEVLRSLVVRN